MTAVSVEMEEEYYGKQCKKKNLSIKPYNAWRRAALCGGGV